MIIMLLHLNIKQVLLAMQIIMVKNGVKIAVPLKYLSNIGRSLEMSLINCKVEVSLNWTENCILILNPNANNNINKATFTITDAKL